MACTAKKSRFKFSSDYDQTHDWSPSHDPTHLRPTPWLTPGPTTWPSPWSKPRPQPWLRSWPKVEFKILLSGWFRTLAKFYDFVLSNTCRTYKFVFPLQFCLHLTVCIKHSGINRFSLHFSDQSKLRKRRRKAILMADRCHTKVKFKLKYAIQDGFSTVVL